MYKRGITLIEILLGVGIILLLLAAATPIYGNLFVARQLGETTEELVQTLRMARVQSIAGLGNNAFGVYFNVNPGPDSYTLYEGASYALRIAANDRTITLDAALSLASTLPGNDINFSKIFGVPSGTGQLQIKSSSGEIERVTINSIGTVQVE
ncbi:MAG: hypothetical protein HYT34_01140 [Candidatus Ryanbacteria bacterium]|nr:hypothetical protein [Candidatus Ryanbacteria bacterium]